MIYTSDNHTNSSLQYISLIFNDELKNYISSITFLVAFNANLIKLSLGGKSYHLKRKLRKSESMGKFGNTMERLFGFTGGVDLILLKKRKITVSDMLES